MTAGRPRTMHRSTACLFLTAFLLAGCGSEPEPSGRVSDGPPVVNELAVTCTEDGSTKVADSEVAVQADGLHVRMDNRTGEPVSMNGLGWDFSEGVSTEVLPVPPGPIGIACWPYSEHDGGDEPTLVDISILDPNGLWVDPELECIVGPESNMIFDHFFASPGERGDPVEIARGVLHDLEKDDVVERAGYPDEKQRVTVRVQREGKTVVAVYLDLAENGGYLLGGANICDATGINVK